MSESYNPEEAQLVLRRALDLAHLPFQPSSDTDLARQGLQEIAAELDIPEHALAVAIAEHAVGIERPNPSILDRVVGPAVVWTHRVSVGDPAPKALAAQQWLETGHGMKTRLSADGTVVATRRTDVVGKVANSVRTLQGQGGLSRTRRISVSVVGFDDTRGVVCVAADVQDKRTAAIAGGSAVAVGASATAAVVGAVLTPVALAALPVAVGVGVLTSRVAHNRTRRAVAEALDETIDGIALEQPAPRVFDGIRRTTLGRSLPRRRRR